MDSEALVPPVAGNILLWLALARNACGLSHLAFVAE